MSGRKFKLDFKPDQRRHTDPDKYVIWVLWLIGYTERSISHIVDMRKKQIAGIISRSDYANRSVMTDQERRKHLQILREIRFEDGVALDGGRLDRIEWALLPLGKAQLRGPVKRKLK